MTKLVWQQNDVYLRIYAAGGFENQQDPLLEFCYSESCAVVGSLETERRPRTAQSKRELIAGGNWDDWALNVHSLYQEKAKDFQKAAILNRSVRLDVMLLCSAQLAMADRPDETHWLRDALATQFQLKGEDNNSLIYDMTFLGTDWE